MTDILHLLAKKLSFVTTPMTLQQDLMKLGFKENDATVYVAVLERGEPGIGVLEKETGLHKQLIYLAAQRLENEGLLSIHEIRGRKHFSIPNPSALEEYAQHRLRQTQEIVPRLFEVASKKRATEDIRIYRTVKGVQHYYLEALRQSAQGSDVLILGINSERYFQIFPQDEVAFSSMEQLRVKRKITWKLLLFGKEESELTLNQRRPLIDLRLLPDAIQAPNDIMIWPDRVGMLFYGSEPYVLDLAGEQTVTGFQQYFQVLWKQGKKIKDKDS